MTYFRNFVLFAITCHLLFSCGGTNNNLSSGQFSDNDSYKINSYAGCCGCRAKYFNIYQKKKIVEQVIYNYNCYSPGAPTKFVFNYSRKGSVLDCTRYIATTQNDFELPITEYERKILSELLKDSTKSANILVPYSKITGFRKVKDKEVSHSFPLTKNGYKLAVK